jgi:hypothetical protein
LSICVQYQGFSNGGSFSVQAVLKEFKDVKAGETDLFRSLLKEVCTLAKATSTWTIKPAFELTPP